LVRWRTDVWSDDAQTDELYKNGNFMKTQFATTLLIIGTLLGPVAALAAEDTDADRAHPKAFVKDSAITSEIKTKLAAEHLTSLGRIHVDTDLDGIVWLTGTARSQEAIDKAVSIARATEHVKSVHSNLTVKKDD
jgi:hyperosmotically inducible protein